MVECFAYNEEVNGSNPLLPKKIIIISSVIYFMIFNSFVLQIKNICLFLLLNML